jgi:serine/threonine protein kinase
LAISHTQYDTRYEIDEKIGTDLFSDVYKGTWKGQTVAIKVFAESIPEKLFVRAIGIWKTLRHPNILPLYGASSTSGDPPWFFVSSYMKHGSLVQYLKRVELQGPGVLGIGMVSTQMPLSQIRSLTTNLGSGIDHTPWKSLSGINPTRQDLTLSGSRGSTPIQEDTAGHRGRDLFRFMHEIAKGMEYLHSQGVLHGNLKGAEVLVDDNYRCVICDFGQSEMKAEAYRIGKTLLPRTFFFSR